MSRALDIQDGKLVWQKKAKGKRQKHTPGAMNKGEKAYSDVLEARKIAGEIAWYGYEAIKLKLADKTYFTPDFSVMDTQGFIELVDVKGRTTREDSGGNKIEKAFSQEDARLKIKVAAVMFPMFTFKTAFPSKEYRGQWIEEIF